MSTSIDNHIVDLEFNNSKFERGVGDTISSLTKLKEALTFDKTKTDGLDELEKKSGKIDFSKLMDAIDKVEKRFTLFGSIAFNALDRIANQAINTGERLVKSLTIDQVSEGYSKYEEKIKGVKTIMSATGKSAEEVNATLSRLNWFTDATSYNFTDMVNNIGKFTSAGVDLEVAVTAMEGIATEASLSGQGINEASRAMYNFAQAIGTGSVKLMDWRSIENANMATTGFKQTIIDTAVELGTLKKASDGTIRTVDKWTKVSVEDFNTALSEGWFSSDVLVKALSKYGEYADEVYKVADQFNTTSEAIASVSAEGMELGYAAFKAAQESKNISDVINAVKDNVSTQWMATFENILGNTSETIEFFSTLEGYMEDIFAYGANNKVQLTSQWKELGGRAQLVQGLWRALDMLVEVMGVVREAMSDVFPPLTAKRLLELSYAFNYFLISIKPSEETLNRIKRIASGVFSVFKLGGEVFLTLYRAAYPILKDVLSVIFELSVAIGDFFTGVRKDFENSGFMTKFPEMVANGWAKLKESVSNLDFVQPFVKAIELIQKALSLFAGNGADGKGSQKDEEEQFGLLTTFSRLLDRLSDTADRLLGHVGPILTKIATGIRTAFDIIKEALTTVFQGFSSDNAMKLLGGGGAAMLLKMLADLKKGVGGITENVTDFLESLNKAFEGAAKIINNFALKVKADALLTIAFALLVLGGALVMIASIDEERLWLAVGALSALAVEIVAMYKAFEMVSKKGTTGFKTLALVTMASSLLTVAKAIAVLGQLSWDRLLASTIAIGLVMVGMVTTFTYLSKHPVNMSPKELISIMTLMSSLGSVADALVKIGQLSWEQVAIGLAGIGGVLLEFAIFNKLVKSSKLNEIQPAFSTIAGSLVIFGVAFKLLAGLEWEGIGKALTAMGGIMAIMVLANKATKLADGERSGIAKLGFAMLEIGTAMLIFSGAAKIIASMQWEGIGKAMTAFAGIMALFGVSSALIDKKGIIKFATALNLLATAMMLFVPTFMIFAALSWEQLGKGLAAFGGSLLVLGVGMAILQGCEKTMLSTGAAMMMWGTGMAMFGAGLVLLTVGMTSFATMADIIVEGWVHFFNAMNTYKIELYTAIIDALIGLSDVVAKFIEEAVVGLFDGVLNAMTAIKEKLPAIAEAFFDALIDSFRVMADKTPEMTEVMGEVLIGMIYGLVKYLSRIDLVDAAEGLATMTAILGMLTEFALVVAEILGIYAMLPAINENLEITKLFLKPFFDWVASYDTSVLEGVAGLGDILASLAAFKNLGEDAEISTDVISKGLSDLGPVIVKFSKDVSEGINVQAIKDSAEAMTAIADLSYSLPRTGGISSIVTGSRDLNKFGTSLTALGRGICNYAYSVTDFTEERKELVLRSTEALSEIVGIAHMIPNSGGIISWLFGDNDLGSFATNIKELGIAMVAYSDSIKGTNLGTANIRNSLKVLKSLTQVASALPVTGGIFSLVRGDKNLTAFSDNIVFLGDGVKRFAESTKDVLNVKIESTANACLSLAELASQVPTTGGIFGLVTGSNAFGVFAMNVGMLGKGLAEFSTNVSDVNSSRISMMAVAAQKLAVMASEIPTSGGLWQALAGSHDIKQFAAGLSAYGTALKSFSDSVSGIDDFSKISSASTAGKNLAMFASKIPTSGGLWQLLAGSKDLGTFSDNVDKFGGALYRFNIKMQKVSSFDKVHAAAGAGSALANFASQIPITGGLWGAEAGSLDIFALDIAAWARGFASFATAVADLKLTDINKVRSVALASMPLADFAAQVPISGGLNENAGNLAIFGEQLKEFGASFLEFDSMFAPDQTFDATKRAAIAARMLADFASRIPSTTYDIGAFGASVISFGGNLKEFSDDIEGVNYLRLTGFNKPIEQMIGWCKELSDITVSDTNMNLDTLGYRLRLLGQDTNTYWAWIKDIDPTHMDSVLISVSDTFARLSTVVSTTGDIAGEHFLSSFTSIGSSMVTAVTSGMLANLSDITNIGSTMIEQIILGANNAVTSKYGSASMYSYFVKFGSDVVKGWTAGLGDDGALQSLLFNGKQLSKTMMAGINSYAKDQGYETLAIFMRNSGNDYLTNFISGLKNQSSLSLLQIAASAIGKTVTDNIHDRHAYVSFYNQMYYIGRMGVEGFAMGIRSNITMATQAATSMGLRSLSSLKTSLEEKSPSKATFEMGVNYGQGFINALSYMMPFVSEASSDVGMEALEQLRQSVYAIDEAMDEEMELNPVIRPVMDYSGIQNGYGTYTMRYRDYGSLVNAMGSPSSVTPGQVTNNHNNNANYSNNFYISGDDPHAIAEEVSHILQQQVERSNAVWA